MENTIQVGENTWYVPGPVNVGIWRSGGQDVYLIDSGNDKAAGKKLLERIKQQGWSLQGIVNTHSHADHIGGNAYLASQTGCRVFAPGVEAAFCRYPVLEPMGLYGGAPPKELQHKFLMAPPSQAETMDSPAFPGALEVLDLAGHTMQMVGLRTPDDVVFLGDCVSSEQTLEKYKVLYLYDVAKYLETLEYVQTLSARLFVPAHVSPVEDMTRLCQVNRQAVWEVAEQVLELCREPKGFEAILQGMFAHYGVRASFEQYAIMGSTLRAYLLWLRNSGRVQAEFEDNLLLWRGV